MLVQSASLLHSLWIKAVPCFSMSILPSSLVPSLTLLRVHCVIIQVTEEDGGQFQPWLSFLRAASQKLSH